MKFRPMRFLTLAVCAAGCWLSALLYGQATTALLRGTIQDTSGGAVLGALVELTSTDTGTSESANTNAEGAYVFPQVRPGHYSLTVRMKGFKVFQRTGMILNVNQKATIDVTLEVGQLSETVTVNSDTPLLNTTDGETGTVISQKNVVDLPLVGRQFLELAFLTPGAVDSSPADYRKSIQGIAPTVNGNRAEQNNYTLNGAENIESFNAQFTIQPSVDAVQEFKMQSGTYNAEYGRAGGAIVNVVTKSGTNSFHGTLYEFLRNSDLNARNFFNSGKSPVRQNEYGGTVGGPIFKNKTFFFFNYEEFKERRGSTISSRFPNAAQLGGDFSGQSAPVIDPVTKLPFPGNKIPANRIDPIAIKMAAFLPPPQTTASSGNNFINSASAKQDNFSYGIRIDHNFSSKDTLYGVLNWNDIEAFTPGPVPNFNGDTTNNFYNRLANLTWLHLFSPSVSNEARLSYQRFRNPEVPNAPKADYPTQLGLTGLSTDPAIRDNFPGYSFGQGYTGIPRYYTYTLTNNGYSFFDNLSWVKGAHTFKFGFGYIQSRIQQAFVANAPTTWTFSGLFSGNAIADFLLGSASQNTVFVQGGPAPLYNSQYHLYAQDQWRVSKTLTLNYGLRYEFHGAWYDPTGTATSLDPKTGNILASSLAPYYITNASSTLGVPIQKISSKSFYPAHACCIGPFMPRLGFAWQPSIAKGVVIRGGYAVSLDSEQGNLINGALAPPAWIRLSTTINQWPGIGFNRNRVDVTNLEGSLANGIGTLDTQAILPNFTEGYTQSWNLTVEKEVKRTLYSVAYVGSKGTHLAALSTWNEAEPGPGPINARVPFPKFGTFTTFENYGASNYHSLQTKAEKRFASGIAFLAAYTYSKGLGNADTLNETRLPLASDMRTAAGRLNFDVRQRFAGSLIYELPFGKGKPFLPNASAFVNALIGGWQVNTINTNQTGYPINLSVSPCLLNGGTGFQCPPNVAGTAHGSLSRSDRGVNQWFNIADFTAPTAYTLGNMQLYSLDGPTGLNNWNTSFMKNTAIKERMNIQFRAEFFNLFNHPTFAAVGTTLGAAQFGKVTSSTNEREVQLALKLLF